MWEAAAAGLGDTEPVQADHVLLVPGGHSRRRIQERDGFLVLEA